MKIDKIIDSNGSNVDKLIALFVKDHQYSITKIKVDQINKTMFAVGFGTFCERLESLGLYACIRSDPYGIELLHYGDAILRLTPYKNKYGDSLPLKDFMKSSIEERLADGFDTYFIATFSSHLVKFLYDNEFVII